MRTRVALMVVASMACTSSLLAAEEPAPKPSASAPTSDRAAPTQSDESAATKADAKPAEKAEEEKAQANASETAPAAKSPADQKASPQRFIPSEQVRADFDVSFPIDI